MEKSTRQWMKILVSKNCCQSVCPCLSTNNIWLYFKLFLAVNKFCRIFARKWGKRCRSNERKSRLNGGGGRINNEVTEKVVTNYNNIWISRVLNFANKYFFISSLFNFATLPRSRDNRKKFKTRGTEYIQGIPKLPLLNTLLQ